MKKMKKIVSVIASIILLLNMSLAYTTQITINGGGIITTSEEGNNVRIIPKVGIEGWVVEEGDVELNEEANSVTSFTMSSENVAISNLILGVNSPNTLAAQDTWYTKGTSIEKSKITSINIENSYTPESTPVASWDASAMDDGTVMVYIEDDNLEGDTYKLTIAGDGSGKIYANTDSTDAFADFTNVTLIEGFKDENDNIIFDTSKVTSMYATFFNCSSLQTLDISSFDTSNLVNMQSMFSLCSNLVSLNLDGVDTSNVTNMSWAFGACYNLQNVDITNLETNKVVNLAGMFGDCRKLTHIDVSEFDTSKVIDMGDMFRGCTSLLALDISNFDTRSIVESSTGIAPNGYTLSIGLTGFASSCPALTSITLGENFGQIYNIATAGSVLGMFYASTNLNTTVINANEVMKNYAWATDNRTVTFTE